MTTSEMSNWEKAEMMNYLAYDMFPNKHKPDIIAEEYYNKDAFPMDSYERAAVMFWHAFINKLFDRGLTEAQVEWLLRSKEMRWMFDNSANSFYALAESLITNSMIETAVKETE